MRRIAGPFCLLLVTALVMALPGLCCCAFGSVQEQTSSCCDDESSPVVPAAPAHQDECNCSLASSPVDQPDNHLLMIEDGGRSSVIPVADLAAMPAAIMSQSFYVSRPAPGWSKSMIADTLLSRHCLLTT